MLTAAYREDAVRTTVRPLTELADGELSRLLTELGAEAIGKLQAEGIDTEQAFVHHFGDLRYSGQEHPVKVPVLAEDLADGALDSLRRRFDEMHQQAYAHALPDHAVEMVNLRALAEVPTTPPGLGARSERQAELEAKSTRRVLLGGDQQPLECPVYDRERLVDGDRLSGPLIIEEWTSTTLVGADQQLQVDAHGNLIVSMRP